MSLSPISMDNHGISSYLYFRMLPLPGCQSPPQTHLNKNSQIGSFPQVGMKVKNDWNHHPVLSISRFPRVVLHLHQKMTQVFFCLMINLSPNSGNKKRPWKTATCYVNYVTTDDDKKKMEHPPVSTKVQAFPSLYQLLQSDLLIPQLEVT